MGQGQRPVFSGTAGMGLVRRDDAHAIVFATMLRWAEWAGVGAMTTHGHGVVEVLTCEG